MSTVFNLKEFTNQYYQKQLNGEKLPCPKCGGNMNTILLHNSLARSNDIYICSPCGTEQAINDFFSPTKNKDKSTWFFVKDKI